MKEFVCIQRKTICSTTIVIVAQVLLINYNVINYNVGAWCERDDTAQDWLVKPDRAWVDAYDNSRSFVF